uniref:RxLR effector candidate protein n=2 Tax=Hyaloperonospora arabidopsidis (strain Emoy2) TaxID=559515 RepID=M4C3A4_HYAAE|nr:RxLR effector candidate protein [Hyaloperonospora arabidopsidis Emoy2]
MRMRCVVFVVSSSFLRGNAGSVVDGDRTDVVAIDQSTLPRLNTDESDGPGLLMAFNKTVNTTAAVTSRPLDDSAVDETTLEEQQSERRASLKGFMGRVRESLYLLLKRSPDKLFKDRFGGHPEAYSPGAINEWLQYVTKFRALHGKYSDEEIFRLVWKELPKANRKKLFQLLFQADIEKDAVLLQQRLAKSLAPDSNVLINVWNDLGYSPKFVLDELDIDFFAEPKLAIHWLRFNEGFRLNHHADVFSFDNIAIYMKKGAGRSHDAKADPPSRASLLPAPSSSSIDGFFTALESAHTDGHDNLDQVAQALREQYGKSNRGDDRVEKLSSLTDSCYRAWRV